MDGASNPCGGEVLANISNGLVALHMQYYGKGPQEAKSYAVDDTIVCVLKAGFTSVEHTLMSEGKSNTVRDMRENIQGAKRDQFVAVVEKETGRKVSAYMSQIHMEPDLAVEVFVLEPE